MEIFKRKLEKSTRAKNSDSYSPYSHRDFFEAQYKDLRDDGCTAFYGATKLFSKRRQQPKQHDTAVVNNVDSDDDAIFDDVDEVRQGGWVEGDGLTPSPARRLSNSDDSSNRPLQSLAVNEDVDRTGDRTRQQTPCHSSGRRERGRGRRGAGGGDGGEHSTSLRSFGRGGVRGGSGSYHRSSSGRAAPADEAAREASPALRPRTRKQTNSSARDNKAAASRTPLLRHIFFSIFFFHACCPDPTAPDVWIRAAGFPTVCCDTKSAHVCVQTSFEC